jgi:hypothetical protein
LFYGSADGVSLEHSLELAIPHDESEEDHDMVVVLAGAGDVNQDGFDDLLVGLPGEDVQVIDEVGEGIETLASAGIVQLHLGSEDDGVEAPAWIMTGDVVGAFFGSSVSAAGDLNGDGYGDVLVGAPGEGNGMQGRVHIFLGQAGGLGSIAEQVLTGTETGGEFGAAVAGVGDLNLDGFDDVVVGAPGHPRAGEGTGVVQVLHGSGEGLVEVGILEPAPGVTKFGSVLQGVGDTNGDGLPDFLVHGIGSDDVHGVYLFEGVSREGTGVNPGAILVSPVDPDIGLPGVRLVAGPGDLNGDGFSDLVIGEPSFGVDQRGRVRVYSGSDPGVLDRVIALQEFLHIYEEEGVFMISASALVEELDGTSVGLERVEVLPGAL